MLEYKVQTPGLQIQDSEGLSLEQLANKHLSKMPACGEVPCDQFFTSAVDPMLEKQVHLTGTEMKTGSPKSLLKLPSDQMPKQQETGAPATVNKADGTLMCG